MRATAPLDRHSSTTSSGPRPTRHLPSAAAGRRRGRPLAAVLVLIGVLALPALVDPASDPPREKASSTVATYGGSLLASSSARAGEPASPEPLATCYRRVARLEVPLEEISGWCELPPTKGDRHVRLLVVVDEGAYDAASHAVHGALHVVGFRIEGDSIRCTGARPVPLRLGHRLPRIDPTWAQGGSMLDLEGCVPLPGLPDHYLLCGERNPEDATDGGANRLYVVRYPGRPGGAGPTRDAAEGEREDETKDDATIANQETADLLAYLRLPDLPDDGINDRLEAVVAMHAPTPATWWVFAFKERTQALDRPPAYFPLRLRRMADGPPAEAAPHGTCETSGAFELGWSGDRPPRRLPTLLPDRNALGAQADACLDRQGRVLVLDRWRREIHVAEVPMPHAPALAHRATWDVHDLIGDVPGEAAEHEPAAPGGRHAGYGRHEAVTIDHAGRIWLAADLGGGRASVVTVLAPRDAPAGEARRSPGGDTGASPDGSAGRGPCGPEAPPGEEKQAPSDPGGRGQGGR